LFPFPTKTTYFLSSLSGFDMGAQSDCRAKARNR